MKILKEKKILIPIIIITIATIIINSILIKKQNKIYQDKVNIVIANMVGEISKEYPNVNEQDIMKIINLKKESIEYGYNILSKYGIDNKEVLIIKGLDNQKREIIIINAITIIAFLVLIMIVFINYKKSREKELEKILKYIQQINEKNYELKIEENSEDELSNLKNELYKITIMLKEQAEKSIKDKNILKKSLEDISHQLKTPLTSISIMLDNIIENPNMDEETRKNFILEINRQIEWINWLIISLLKLSRLESNVIEFTREKINVLELIKNVEKNLSIPLDIKQQKIIINGENAIIYGDYKWQLEAITNIVKNCIEHSPERSRIYIDFYQNKFYTGITIKDEGKGIDKKDIKHIFERFYKGENSTESSVGIGLAISKNIIEKDGGNIKCSSEKNNGAIFEIKYLFS